MKAVVFHDAGDIRLDTINDPSITEDFDAIVRITASAICGTDLHMIRGTMPGMKPGTVLGHEGVGVVESVGKKVRNFQPGDRVVIPSTIACGTCSYCRKGYQAQCDNANPNGKQAGTAFYGGPESTGPFHGLQSEYARVPFANINLVRLPKEVTDEEAILISDIFPTGYFGADIADIHDGHTVAVYGCGPVGLFAIRSAQMFGAGRVIAIDGIPSRLEQARRLGAEVINFNQEDPTEVILELTGGIGVDRAIDAVGVDSESPISGPAKEKADQQREDFEQQGAKIVQKSGQKGDLWKPGDAPTLAALWAVQTVAKAGLVSTIGVYPPTDMFYPFGMAMNKNLTLKMGNCNHRTYIPKLVDFVKRGQVKPTSIISQAAPLMGALEAYEAFDKRESGWIKVELKP